MKKLLLALVWIGVTGALKADDSYLYWMMGDTSSYSSYTSARVLAVDSSWNKTVLSLADENFSSLGTSLDKASVADSQDFGYGYYANLATYTGSSYSYYVELLSDTTVLANAKIGGWSDVADYIYKNSMSPAAAAGVTGGFVAGSVPEPTSGLMLLMGVAALALRRRRRT